MTSTDPTATTIFPRRKRHEIIDIGSRSQRQRQPLVQGRERAEPSSRKETPAAGRTLRGDRHNCRRPAETRRQLSITKRAAQGHAPISEPNDQKPERRDDRLCHAGRRQENTDSDDLTDQHHDRGRHAKLSLCKLFSAAELKCKADAKLKGTRAARTKNSAGGRDRLTKVRAFRERCHSPSSSCSKHPKHWSY